MKKQIVCIHGFDPQPQTLSLKHNETFRATFNRLLNIKKLGLDGDFYWHRQNGDGTETLIILSYNDSPKTLHMHCYRDEKITWKRATVFRMGRSVV
jgi:hypothetical protein